MEFYLPQAGTFFLSTELSTKDPKLRLVSKAGHGIVVLHLHLSTHPTSYTRNRYQLVRIESQMVTRISHNQGTPHFM